VLRVAVPGTGAHCSGKGRGTSAWVGPAGDRAVSAPAQADQAGNTRAQQDR